MANYINNKEFLEQIIKYKNICQERSDKGLTPPKIPEEIGESILSIATNLAKRPNFSSYTFKDEMISDGVENCLRYLNNFDPEKSSNPFSYFTQIIHFAFVRRITSESKHSYIKIKSFEFHELYNNHSSENKNHINLIKTILNDNTQHIVEKFESKIKKNKEKVVIENDGSYADLEDFME